MVADMATDMEVHMVAEKVANMVANMFAGGGMVTKLKKGTLFSSSCQIWYPQSGERVRQGCWLIGPKLC